MFLQRFHTRCGIQKVSANKKTLNASTTTGGLVCSAPCTPALTSFDRLTWKRKKHYPRRLVVPAEKVAVGRGER